MELPLYISHPWVHSFQSACLMNNSLRNFIGRSGKTKNVSNKSLRGASFYYCHYTCIDHDLKRNRLRSPFATDCQYCCNVKFKVALSLKTKLTVSFPYRLIWLDTKDSFFGWNMRRSELVWMDPCVMEKKQW